MGTTSVQIMQMFIPRVRVKNRVSIRVKVRIKVWVGITVRSILRLGE